jgi:FtsX-like permease family
MAVRRIGYPLSLAWRRLTRGGERVGLVVLGIAAGAALLAAVLAGSLVAQDRSVARATANVAPESRVVRLTWGGIASGAGTDATQLDRTARRALEPLVRSPTRAMLFRTSQAQGHLFDLGAIDGLARYVHVRSGRLPKPCRSTARCEVLQLGGSGPVPKVKGLTLAVVGRATLDSPIPFGNLITRETYASILSSALRYHTTATPPLLLAEGVDELARAEVFVPSYRSYTWTAPLRPGDVHPWNVDDFAAKVTQTRSELQGQSLAFDLTAPLVELRAADETGRIAGRRLLLIGGEAAALLLAFAVLAATGLRRETEAQWRRLTWYGARRWQLVLGSVAEAGLVALLAVVVGWAVGSAVGALVAAAADAPVGEVLIHSVVDWRGFALAAGIVIAAAAVVVLSMRARSVPLDIAAVGAAVAVAIALARGAADTHALADEGGTGAVLLLIPALITFVAAVIWARALGPTLRALERRARTAAVPMRLAALSLARNPGRAAVAVAFLVVSLGLALFAETYRSTLTRAQRDQAAFAAPTNYLAREDLTRLVPVLQAAPLSAFGRDAIPVLRLSGNVHRLEESSGLTLLALPARAIPRLRWRDDYSSLSQRELAERLRPSDSVAVQGVHLPQDGRRLEVPLRARGDEVAVRATVLTQAGSARGFSLGTTAAPRLAATIPPDARGGLLLGFTFDVTNTGLHGVPNAGINAQAVAQGTMQLGRPRVDGRPVALDFARWRGDGGITSEGRGRLRYLITGENIARFRSSQPTDDRTVPVAVSPTLAEAAGPGGILPLALGNGTVVGHVVGTVRHVPTVDGDAVLADGPTIASALAAGSPGSAAVDEVWTDVPPPAANVLDVTSYDEVLHDLRAEPLARGTLFTLVGAALTALALALVGLLLVVVSDLRDERGELFDLEAQGAEPATLRRHLRVRAALAAGFGVLGGVITGAVLAAIVVALVTLTAGAGSVELPLLLGFDWPVVILGLLAYAALAALLVGIATRRAFRADVAGRFAEVGA